MNFKSVITILSLLSIGALSSPIQEETTYFTYKDEPTEQPTDYDDDFEYTLPDKIDTPKSVLSSLDTSIDPCDDFYQYTCGGWIKEHPLIHGVEDVDNFDMLTRKNRDYFLNILKNEYKPDESFDKETSEYDEKNYKKIKDFYDSCMKWDYENNNSKETFVELFRKLKSNDENETNVDRATNLFSKLDHYDDGNYLFEFDLYYERDYDEENEKIIKARIGKPSSDKRTDYYYDNEMIPLYKEFINNTLSTVFENDKDRKIDVMTESIFDFEKRLTEINKICGEDELESIENPEVKENIRVLSKGFLYNKEQTINSLNRKYPFINWKKYFENIYEYFGINGQITDKYVIVNTAPKYFKYLNKLLKETSPETLIYYAEWNLLLKYINYASIDVRQIFDEFYEKVYEIEENDDNEDEDENENEDRIPEFIKKIKKNIDERKNRNCVYDAEDYMNEILIRKFVKDHFNDEIKERVVEMAENIKEAMKNRIPQLEWLDEETKNNAIEKVNKMTQKIGYPEEYLNPKRIYEIYKDLEVDADNYLLSVINVESFYKGRTLRSIGLPKDNEGWAISPQIVNAVYIFILNSMNIPAGIIQPPFYNINNPDYMNYATLGTVIGHELTHGFDDTGRNFDANGEFNNWWSNSTFEEYDRRAQCYVDQYSEFYIESDGEKYNVDGELTLGENIADNGGIARAYEAWQLSMKKNQEMAKKNNMSLPGLEGFTFDQLFYISFGQLWCSNTEEYLLIDYLRDEHSPAKFRVLGSVSNSEHFAKTFNCPKNSPMNPEKKCSLW